LVLPISYQFLLVFGDQWYTDHSLHFFFLDDHIRLVQQFIFLDNICQVRCIFLWLIRHSSLHDIITDPDETIVSIVGNEIAKTEDVLKRLFESIKEVPVRMVSYGGSPHNISLLVPSSHKTKTLQLLNKGLFGLE